MQLLIQTAAPDYDTWKAGFDAEAENIADAGLNTLQIWRGEGGAVLVLFEVANRPGAEAWLAKRRGFGDDLAAQFLRTA